MLICSNGIESGPTFWIHIRHHLIDQGSNQTKLAIENMIDALLTSAKIEGKIIPDDFKEYIKQKALAAIVAHNSAENELIVLQSAETKLERGHQSDVQIYAFDNFKDLNFERDLGSLREKMNALRLEITATNNMLPTDLQKIHYTG